MTNTAHFPKLLSSQIAFDIARSILDGFDKHYRLFRETSRAAKQHFEAGTWKAAQIQRNALQHFGLHTAIRERFGHIKRHIHFAGEFWPSLGVQYR